MDSAISSCGEAHSARAPGWQASLALGFCRDGARSVLARRRHVGPFLVQKPLYPEGPATCHAVLLHPPGGIAGGDELALSAELDPGAAALLTTPAATKWYRSAGPEAVQQCRFRVETGAVLEWLPLPSILFRGAAVRTEIEVRLAPDAAYAGWEILGFGRQASGEVFDRGRITQRLTILRGGRPIWVERLVADAADRFFGSPIGLAGRPVMGSLTAAAGPVPPPVLEACRAIAPAEGEGGVTALPEILSARYRGASTEAAFAWFQALWSVLRPWYARRAALAPRIWAT